MTTSTGRGLAVGNQSTHKLTALIKKYFFVFLIAESIDLAGSIYAQRAIQLSPSVSLVAAVESTLPLLVILLSSIFYAMGRALKVHASFLSVLKTQIKYGQEKVAVSIVIGIGFSYFYHMIPQCQILHHMTW